MAITTTTISKLAGWASTDVILQLEEAFTWLGWHGSQVSGIVTSFVWSGGGSGSTLQFRIHEDVPVATTTGIGTGASFYIYRGDGSGSITQILVNRPGVGYTQGEYVTLSAEDIGGAANGAVAIGITVNIDSVGYGGTANQFFDKNIGSNTAPWAVLKLDVDPSKKYGSTYRGFQVNSTNLHFRSGSGFHPSNITNTSNGGLYYGNRFTGSSGLDVNDTTDGLSDRYLTSTVLTSQSSPTFANSTSYQLDLNVFRSGIDPDFAVFSFRHPTLSSTHLTGNTYTTFIIHNFTSSLYDLNHLFLGGTTFIIPQSSSLPSLRFLTYASGSNNGTRRTAEFGHINRSSGSYKDTYYYSNSYPQSNTEYLNTFYYRSSANSSGGYYNSSLSSEVYFNAVIKGIPLNSTMIPCPYYLPDDFVLIDFDYGVPSANIQQGDTITVSGSEVYTVITGSYNQTTRTRGILFCARTV